MIGQFFDDVADNLLGLCIPLEHACAEPFLNNAFRPFHRVFAFTDEGGVIFSDNHLPKGNIDKRREEALKMKEIAERAKNIINYEQGK